ncbi:MAG: SemiSWEET family sugar transporter [Burkholderiales bacterium]|nr:SemiSWEET family sugar transporter [Burkholderiales bacterium]
MTDSGNLIGMVAGFCTTVSFVPQVWRVWKTRHARDISLAMYLFFVIGIILWFIYGMLIQSLPVILFNAITFVLASAVLVMKLRFDARDQPHSN